ncbi:hypothetical protein RhiirA5_367511 [Rhizophagus irregularis]|uniref:Uncharacterized protein n=1 Tax=Rhizophagus irregularis TaxID=588596 RepID=A0A2I1EV52_9GLOM|nr:hypothetical protein RhiirA5_367511 [Rhizophagus irregularis]PKY26011.1 hypothetical protein RhiirB3_414670 [Rhizophagus irregularis]
MQIGHTEVAGIFKKGFEDTKASYGFKIVDECKNTLFDLTDGLNIKVDGCGVNVTVIAVNSRSVVLMVP